MNGNFLTKFALKPANLSIDFLFRFLKRILLSEFYIRFNQHSITFPSIHRWKLRKSILSVLSWVCLVIHHIPIRGSMGSNFSSRRVGSLLVDNKVNFQYCFHRFYSARFNCTCEYSFWRSSSSSLRKRSWSFGLENRKT